MNKNVFAVVVMLGALAVAAPQKASDDEIRALGTSLDAAWNKGDVKALLALYADDASVVNFQGIAAHGKTEMEKWLPTALKAHPQRTTTIKRIRWIRPDLAFVDAEAQLAASTGADGTAVPAQRVQNASVVMKHGNSWLIEEIRGFIWVVPPRTPEPIKK